MRCKRTTPYEVYMTSKETVGEPTLPPHHRTRAAQRRGVQDCVGQRYLILPAHRTEGQAKAQQEGSDQHHKCYLDAGQQRPAAQCSSQVEDFEKRVKERGVLSCKTASEPYSVRTDRNVASSMTLSLLSVSRSPGWTSPTDCATSLIEVVIWLESISHCSHVFISERFSHPVPTKNALIERPYDAASAQRVSRCAIRGHPDPQSNFGLSQ